MSGTGVRVEDHYGLNSQELAVKSHVFVDTRAKGNAPNVEITSYPKFKRHPMRMHA